MNPNDYDQRIAAIADAPPEAAAYRAWLDTHDTTVARDYLFTEKRTRFEPKRHDVVVPLGALSVAEAKGRTIVSCADHAITIPVPDVSAADARTMLTAIDGRRCLLEVQLDSGLPPRVMALMLRATFGRVVLAPEAVGELEAQISGVEITRFPSLPYAIMRPYWTNMAAVRERVPKTVPTGEAFATWLRHLHVVALMGAELDSFYKPASPGADQLVAPGTLFLERVVVKDGERGALFLSGPRVNAKLLGGEAYHRAVFRSVGDEEALTRTASVVANDVEWGRVVWARSERDPEPGPWFCPPRPMTDRHFAELEAHLRAAFEAASHAAAVAAAARFHWCFVRLHPFHNANQSLAMNLANAALVRHGGAGIPHLVLDHFAHRLRLDAYVAVFTRAVAAYGAVGDANTRIGVLTRGNDASYRFIDKLGKHTGPLEPLVAADPEGARFALLSASVAGVPD